MTYIDLVNQVLIRLREDEVTTVNQTAYSKMIGAFVNDAKRLIEAGWDWTHLRQEVTVTTAQGTGEYTWTGKGSPVQILSSWNDTSNLWLSKVSQAYIDKRNYTDADVEGTPIEYTLRSINAAKDSVFEVYPTPDGVYDLKFNAVIKQGDLSADADELLIPQEPVIHMAVFFAARERGETGGTSVAEYAGIADQFLSDAIALDAANHEEELTLTAGYVWPNNTTRGTG